MRASMPSRPPTSRRPPPRTPASRAVVDGVVSVVNRQRAVPVDRRWLTNVARRAIEAIGRPCAEISVVVVDDAGIARLHDRWLGQPDPTDVITFDLAGPGDGPLHGDIAVSGQTACRVARDLGWQTRHELAYYVVHGLLHLAGEDDVDPHARRRMRASERRVMAAIGLPMPPRRRPRRVSTRRPAAGSRGRR